MKSFNGQVSVTFLKSNGKIHLNEFFKRRKEFGDQQIKFKK